jgi:tetratricopeptide (TPR) repeat protein
MTMSAKDAELGADEMSCCASCGVAGGDDIKLRNCTACYLVRYCGVKCQKDHWKKHKKDCRKRAAELRDELLFKQPESTHFGDCPICCLPLPLDRKKYIMTPCCSKIICNGCDFARLKQELEQRRERTCIFCRHPVPNQQEANRILMKRVEANDPVALLQLGSIHFNEGNYKSAFEYFTKAAQLGDVTAHYQLSVMYKEGVGVEQDEKKMIYHLEQAAIGGDPGARYSLGAKEWNNGQYKRAIKHFIIAANFGHDDAMKELKLGYRDGLVSKDDFASTLRAHKAAADAMKSPQRDAAPVRTIS